MTAYALHVSGDCGDPCAACDHEAQLELEEQLDTHDCFAPGCTNRPTQRLDGVTVDDRPWFFCDEDAARVADFLDSCPHTPLHLDTAEGHSDCLAVQREDREP